MKRIREELHEVEGILVNKKFMAIYVGLFACAAILDIVAFLIQAGELRHDDPKDQKYYRI